MRLADPIANGVMVSCLFPYPSAALKNTIHLPTGLQLQGMQERHTLLHRHESSSSMHCDFTGRVHRSLAWVRLCNGYLLPMQVVQLPAGITWSNISIISVW